MIIKSLFIIEKDKFKERITCSRCENYIESTKIYAGFSLWIINYQTRHEKFDISNIFTRCDVCFLQDDSFNEPESERLLVNNKFFIKNLKIVLKIQPNFLEKLSKRSEIVIEHILK